MSKMLPSLEYEIPLWDKNFLVVGIDEVGRGALAGPLGVGAVAFDDCNGNSSTSLREKIKLIGINDSKKLSAKKRDKCAEEIKKRAIFASAVHVSVETINTHGITYAFKKGVQDLVDKIILLFPDKQIFLLIDAFTLKEINGISNNHILGIIRGDSISQSIAAASIIAKVRRDLYMRNLAKIYPSYSLEHNVGYGTKAHIAALKRHGTRDVHRTGYLKNIF